MITPPRIFVVKNLSVLVSLRRESSIPAFTFRVSKKEWLEFVFLVIGLTYLTTVFLVTSSTILWFLEARKAVKLEKDDRTWLELNENGLARKHAI